MNIIYTRFYCLCLTATLLAGCAATAPIDTKQFTAYHDAVESLRKGSETALAFEREWTYRNYVAALSEGGGVNPQNLILDFPDGPKGTFAWSLASAPVYITIQNSERSLKQVNDVFSNYTQLLLELAGSKSDDAERIKSLGKALNDKSQSVERALGAEPDKKNVAFFSAVAAEAAQAYLNNKRRKSLQTVLRENQAAVDAFARLGADVASISAAGIKSEYQNDTSRWMRRVTAASGAGRVKLVQEQLALNERTIGQLNALQQIHDSYLALAQKHAELASSVATKGKVDFRYLLGEGQRLRDFYRELQAKEGSKAEEN